MKKLQITAFTSVLLLFTLLIGCKNASSSQSSKDRNVKTTPDLIFNELQGDVKKVTLSNSCLTFDEDGKWTNEPDWNPYDKEHFPEKTNHPKIERDADGYINRIYMDIDADDEYEDVTWKNGRLLKIGEVKYDYNTDGYVISGRMDYAEYDYVYINTYCNYVVDEMGNWIERDVIERTIYFNNSEDFLCNKETRTIEYYNSNGGSHRKLENSPQQKQALEAYYNYLIQ